MPNIDEVARAWELDTAGRVGRAVLRRRKALGLSAVQLAARTKELRYPISRVAISKIENNTRAGKLDVAELLTLSVALEIPPALLLFPGYPSAGVVALPGESATSFTAVEWLSGAAPLSTVPLGDDTEVKLRSPNPGTELVAAAINVVQLRRNEFMAEMWSRTGETYKLEMLRAEMQTSAAAADTANAELWGGSWHGEPEPAIPAVAEVTIIGATAVEDQSIPAVAEVTIIREPAAEDQSIPADMTEALRRQGETIAEEHAISVIPEQVISRGERVLYEGKSTGRRQRDGG